MSNRDDDKLSEGRMSNRDDRGKLILHSPSALGSIDAHINEGTASAFADDELTERGMQRVRAHTVTCHTCRDLVDESQRVRLAVSELLATIGAATARATGHSSRVQERVLKAARCAPSEAQAFDETFSPAPKRVRVNLSRAGVWRHRRAVLATTGIVVLAASAITASLSARKFETISRWIPWAADSTVHLRVDYKKLPNVTIYGSVRTEEGFAIKNAAVVVIGKNLSQGRNTDSNGNFDFGAQPRTAVKIEIHALGFKPTTIPLQYHDANSLQISARLVREVLQLNPSVIRGAENKRK
ncbi:MAG: carboxypeptidase regulatory-like domain-containing protein [Gemmatimonadaceae bacterium]